MTPSTDRGRYRSAHGASRLERGLALSIGETA